MNIPIFLKTIKNDCGTTILSRWFSTETSKKNRRIYLLRLLSLQLFKCEGIMVEIISCSDTQIMSRSLSLLVKKWKKIEQWKQIKLHRLDTEQITQSVKKWRLLLHVTVCHCRSHYLIIFISDTLVWKLYIPVIGERLHSNISSFYSGCPIVSKLFLTNTRTT